MPRYCFHADESFVNTISRDYQVVRITENEPGYTPVSENHRLDVCQQIAKEMNREHGLTDEDVREIRLSSMRASNFEDKSDDRFNFTVETDHGATFTPWTNQWAIGFKVTADNKPDRYIVLNPSGSNDQRGLDDTDVFLFVVDPAEYTDLDMGVPGATENTLGGMLDSPVCFVNIWDED